MNTRIQRTFLTLLLTLILLACSRQSEVLKGPWQIDSTVLEQELRLLKIPVRTIDSVLDTFQNGQMQFTDKEMILSLPNNNFQKSFKIKKLRQEKNCFFIEFQISIDIYEYCIINDMLYVKDPRLTYRVAYKRSQ